MADEKNGGVLWVAGLVAAALISGAVGLMFAGGQQAARNQATDVAGIDVIRNDINNVRERLDTLAGTTLGRPELDSRLEALAAQISTVEKTTNDTIIRRFGEDVAVPIAVVRTDTEKNEDQIANLRERVAALEAKLESLPNE